MMELTVRAYHRIIKTARTIADMDGEEKIGEKHLPGSAWVTGWWIKNTGGDRTWYMNSGWRAYREWQRTKGSD